MVHMDDPSSKWTICDPQGFGWLKYELKWLEMLDTPRQIFSIIKRGFQNIYVKGFACQYVSIFDIFQKRQCIFSRMLIFIIICNMF